MRPPLSVASCRALAPERGALQGPARVAVSRLPIELIDDARDLFEFLFLFLGRAAFC